MCPLALIHSALTVFKPAVLIVSIWIYILYLYYQIYSFKSYLLLHPSVACLLCTSQPMRSCDASFPLCNISKCGIFSVMVPKYLTERSPVKFDSSQRPLLHLQAKSPKFISHNLDIYLMKRSMYAIKDNIMHLPTVIYLPAL